MGHFYYGAPKLPRGGMSFGAMLVLAIIAIPLALFLVLLIAMYAFAAVAWLFNWVRF